MCDDEMTMYPDSEFVTSEAITSSAPIPSPTIAEPTTWRLAFPEFNHLWYQDLGHNAMFPDQPGPATNIALESVPISIQCMWGLSCGIPITSAKFTAIEAHLKSYHFGGGAQPSWSPKQRGRCQWGGCKYQRDMYYQSFAKHIATQHLYTTASQCPHCDSEFTRDDSRNRHARSQHATQTVLCRANSR